MRWLTRDWHGSGGDSALSDLQVADNTAEYQRHHGAVLPHLPDDFKTLAGEPIAGTFRSLHDGRVERWEADLPDRFVLELVVELFGNGAHCGYERLTVEYREAELLGCDEHDLAIWLGDERTELLYQEVDALPDGRFEHRHLLWPCGEFGVRFKEIAVTGTAATPEDYDWASRPATQRITPPAADS